MPINSENKKPLDQWLLCINISTKSLANFTPNECKPNSSSSCVIIIKLWFMQTKCNFSWKQQTNKKNVIKEKHAHLLFGRDSAYKSHTIVKLRFDLGCTVHANSKYIYMIARRLKEMKAAFRPFVRLNGHQMAMD